MKSQYRGFKIMLTIFGFAIIGLINWLAIDSGIWPATGMACMAIIYLAPLCYFAEYQLQKQKEQLEKWIAEFQNAPHLPNGRA